MLDRKIRKTVERAFYGYKQNVAQGAEALADLCGYGLTAKYGAVGGSSAPSNPTERSAIELAEGTDAAKWCRVVEKTLEHFRDTGKDTLIRLRYFDRLSERRVCEKLYVEKSSYYTWVDVVLTYAAMHAIQSGLIKI